MSDQTIRYLCRISSQSKSGRLLLLPPAGAGVGFWRPFERWFRPHFGEILALCPPGREILFAQPPATSIESLARAVLDELPDDGALLTIAGHSMGAIVGLEICRQMQEIRSPPTHLVVSGCAPPSLRAERKLHLESSATLRQIISRMGGTPSDVLHCPGLWQVIEPILRSDFYLLSQYQAPATLRLRFPITALGGSEDSFAPPCAVRAWRNATAARFRHLTLSGGHFFLADHVATYVDATLCVPGES
jgi:surfactin synthase thioesterase subunit